MSTLAPTAPFPIVDWLSRRTRTQRRAGLAVLAIVVIVGLARLAAGMLLDRWWFDTVTDVDVWATRVAAQALLAVAALVISGITLVGAALVGLRTGPAPDNGPNRLVQRYRQRMGPAHAWVLVGVAIYLALRMGYAAMAQWQPWLLFVRGADLGQPTPDVGWDLGYHLFRLPFLVIVSSWLRQLVLVATVLAAVGHLANGALRLPGRGRRSSPAALTQLAVLAAGAAILQALDYVFVARPSTATNTVGAFDGPGFTIVKVVLPGMLLLALVALAAAGTALWSVRTRRWRPTLALFGGWALAHVAVLVLLPGVVQSLVVRPAEGERELAYLTHHLEATRTAFGLDTVEVVTAPLADGIAAGDAIDAVDELDRVPLFGEDQLVAPLQVLKGTTGTRISDVDLDRYVIDGELRPVLVTARNASRSDLPERGWVQEHLVYTHGDGVVAVPADATSPDGRPDVDALAESLQPERSQLYFGEQLAGWYAIVGTARTELGGEPFAADTGLSLASRFRRAVFALAVGQSEPLLSAELGDDSQLLYRRDVKERLQYLAPFLAFDANPYPVVADGRVTWVVDGYTTSATYPYAQFSRRAGLPKASGLRGRPLNYVHASIKATVDAYDGTVHLYRTEVGGGADPILDAWDTVFPGLVEPIANMPATLRSHLLYPADLFSIQTEMLGRYHVTDPETLFSGTDSWAVSASAGDGVARGDAASATGPAPAVSLFLPALDASDGSLDGHWVAIRPFGPGAIDKPTSVRDELASVAIADHDDPERLRILRIESRPGRPVSSPQVAQSAIDTDGDLAALFTLLNANGSAVQFGPMTPVLIGDGLVWVRPIVVTGTATTTTPRLYGVAAVSNGIIGQAVSVVDALREAVSGP